MSKLNESEDSCVTLKSISPTRCTAKTDAIAIVLKDYEVLIETVDEVYEKTHDEYGTKAKGVLTCLEQFDTSFVLQLAELLFSTSELVSKALQAKDVSLQEALSSIKVAVEYYKSQRKDKSFDFFLKKWFKKLRNLELDNFNFLDIGCIQQDIEKVPNLTNLVQQRTITNKFSMKPVNY
uniref:Uncharacterized protein n=1 Tax=Amphimedon queenslandica TaxID=400682 RepID=A0A1X7U9E7_AMPQE